MVPACSDHMRILQAQHKNLPVDHSGAWSQMCSVFACLDVMICLCSICCLNANFLVCGLEAELAIAALLQMVKGSAGVSVKGTSCS